MSDTPYQPPEANVASTAAPASNAERDPAIGRGEVGGPVQDNVFQPLRIWPAAMLVALMVLCRFGLGTIAQPSLMVMTTKFVGPAVLGIFVVGWWLLASRATRREKIWGTIGIVVITIVATALADPTMWGLGTLLYQWPVGIAAFALATIPLARNRMRWIVALAGLAVGLLSWDLVRMTGTTGKFKGEFAFRFEPTNEEIYLSSLKRNSNDSAQPNSTGKPTSGLNGDAATDAATGSDAGSNASAGSNAPAGTTLVRAEAEWPDFRGPHRDSVIDGVTLQTDWDAQSIKTVWGPRRVGPAWSSFAVGDGRLFTQEQRGDKEATICLDADTGQTLWAFETEGRFWESVAGAGPRGTPTIGDGVIYSMGAAGTLACLDADDGSLVWRRDVSDDAGRTTPPQWGYASSPLYVDTDPPMVVIHAGRDPGVEADDDTDGGVIAYDAGDGSILWRAVAGGHSYSSPQRAKLAGYDGVLMVDSDGLRFYSTAGEVLASYSDPALNYRTLQPLVAGDDVVLSTPLNTGAERLKFVKSESGNLVIQSVWRSTELKPDFNDMVLYKDHLYAFDGNIFACVDFQTGKKLWKRGRYGNGQVLLLKRDGQLLVITERGKLKLIQADTSGLRELAEFDALEGKTWNHPVLIGRRLYVRNAAFAAAYELPIESTAEPATEPTTE